MKRSVGEAEVRLEVAGRIASLAIERPPLNVLDIALIERLRDVVRGLADRDDWSVLICNGTDRAFSAGVDVEDHLPERIEGTLAAFHQLIVSLASLDRPTIAVVRGHCLGGGMELAMAFDFVVAAEDATFGQPEIKLAALPPFALSSYARFVGPRRAFADLASGRTFRAPEAEAAGYITASLPAAEVDTWAERLASDLRDLSPVALRGLKRAFRAAAKANLAEGLREAERRYIEEVARTPDAVEGIQAFREKRKPKWEAGS